MWLRHQVTGGTTMARPFSQPSQRDLKHASHCIWFVGVKYIGLVSLILEMWLRHQFTGGTTMARPFSQPSQRDLKHASHCIWFVGVKYIGLVSLDAYLPASQSLIMKIKTKRRKNIWSEMCFLRFFSDPFLRFLSDPSTFSPLGPNQSTVRNQILY